MNKSAFYKQFISIEHRDDARIVTITAPDDGLHDRRVARLLIETAGYSTGVGSDEDIKTQLAEVLERWADVIIDTTREAAQDALGLSDIADGQRRKIAMTVSSERVLTRVKI